MPGRPESGRNVNSKSEIFPAMHPEQPSTPAPERRLARLLRFYLGAVVFILPFKFGGFVTNGEQAHFPLDVWEWLFFTCLPSYLAPVLCGIGLLASVLIHPRPRRDCGLLAPLVWSLPLLAGAVGLLRTTERDYAWQWYGHFAGVAAMAWAAWWCRAADRKIVPVLLNCLTAAALIVALHGWRQHFGGLAAMQENMEAFSVEQGVQVQEVMKQKMAQTRSYGTFVDPNVYAAHLLLCFPLALLALRSWARRFTPQRLSLVLFVGGGIVLFGGALFWSGSRGAAIGLAAGLGLAAWHWPRLRQWRWHGLLPVLAVLLALTAFAVLARQQSRDGLKSASARIEYYRAAVHLIRQFPISGAGLGEFFPWYMRLKPLLAEETRDPHNLLLSMTSQCGLMGMLAALAIVGLPFYLAWRPLPNRRHLALRAAACAGAGAWGVHALFQFNELIPATVCLVPVIGMMALVNLSPEEETASSADDEAAAAPLAPVWLRVVLVLGGCLACLPIGRVPGERILQVVSSSRDLHPEKAIAMLREASRRLPRSPVPPRMLAEFGMALRHLDIAVEGAEEMTRRTPHRAAAHLRLARLRILRGEWELAETALEQAALWYPGDGDVYMLRALARVSRTEPSFQKRLQWWDMTSAARSVAKELGDKVAVSIVSPDSILLRDLFNAVPLTYPDGRAILFVKEGE